MFLPFFWETMIVGHGIDLQAISAIAEAYDKNKGFAEKVLTKSELLEFHQLSGKRQMAYLAGRWAAKEAFAKALGTGMGRLRFQDIEILKTNLGAPILNSSFFTGKSFVSISHSGDFVQASVILEGETYDS